MIGGFTLLNFSSLKLFIWTACPYFLHNQEREWQTFQKAILHREVFLNFLIFLHYVERKPRQWTFPLFEDQPLMNSHKAMKSSINNKTECSWFYVSIWFNWKSEKHMKLHINQELLESSRRNRHQFVSLKQICFRSLKSRSILNQ